LGGRTGAIEIEVYGRGSYVTISYDIFVGRLDRRLFNEYRSTHGLPPVSNI
jgi:hypothetical protein